jgi:hypothetical protein
MKANVGTNTLPGAERLNLFPQSLDAALVVLDEEVDEPNATKSRERVVVE